MKLFNYLLKEYFRFVLGTIILCLFLFILFDFIHKTTSYFGKHNPSPHLIFQFYVYQIPIQVMQAFPIASLISSVVTMAILGRSNEITAMRAIGMSPFRIALPLLAGGSILTATSFLLAEWVIPKTAQKMHYVTEVLIEGDDEDSLNDDAHWIRNGSQFVNFKEYDKDTQKLSGIKILMVNPNFKLEQSIEAQSARYNYKKQIWELNQLRFLNFDPSGNLILQKDVLSQDMSLPIEMGKLKIERRNPDELSLGELTDRIENGVNTGADVLGLKIAWHVKLAYPFAALIISLIGLKFGFLSERTTETIKGMLVAFSFGICYWFVLSACRALASSGDIHPFFSGWVANFFLIIYIGNQIWQLRRV